MATAATAAASGPTAALPLLRGHASKCRTICHRTARTRRAAYAASRCATLVCTSIVILVSETSFAANRAGRDQFHAYPVSCERRLGDQDHDHVPNHRGTARSRVRRAACPCRTVASRATLGSWPRRRSAAVGPAAGPVMATLSNDGRRIASRRSRGKLGSEPQRSSRKHSPGSLPMGSRASSRRICTAWPRRSRVAGARPDSGRVVFDADPGTAPSVSVARDIQCLAANRIGMH